MFNRNIVKTSRTAVLIVCLLTLTGCATGSSTVTGNARSAIDPNVVKFYLEPPQEYEIIGIVESSSDVELSSQAARDRTIEELKVQAAKIGANGVLITGTGSQGSIWSDERTKTAKGRAIFVIQE
jgi:spermidine/putrescine-binding protein